MWTRFALLVFCLLLKVEGQDHGDDHHGRCQYTFTVDGPVESSCNSAMEAENLNARVTLLEAVVSRVLGAEAVPETARTLGDTEEIRQQLQETERLEAQVKELQRRVEELTLETEKLREKTCALPPDSKDTAGQNGGMGKNSICSFLLHLVFQPVSSSSIMPAPLLGDVFPDFDAESTVGKIRLHEYLGDSWGILFSHPRDYTPVCTTELGRAAALSHQFAKRNVKMMGLSIDSVEEHHGWSKDILSYNNDESMSEFPFPIIADANRELAVELGMLDPNEKDQCGMPLTARCVFVIGPDKKLKLSLLYPATTGRNFDEILRVIDSLQLTASQRVATPVNWKPGDRVMVPPNIPEEEAKSLYPAGVYTKELPSGKKYLRYTPQP